MFDRNDLEGFLQQVQRSIQKADPELAQSLVAEPPRDPDEPLLFEYLDRLIAALKRKIAEPKQPARRQMQRALRYIRWIRMATAEQWDMR